MALASEDVIDTRFVIEGTVFHEESQALTVMVKGLPTVWGAGVPTLPLAVPGAAASPGTRTWSLEYD
jgi:hypothetical protein